MTQKNVDEKVIREFGLEWSRFDKTLLTLDDHSQMFNNYSNLFPLDGLPEQAIEAYVGCECERWATLLAGRVEHLALIDPSSEVIVAGKIWDLDKMFPFFMLLG